MKTKNCRICLAKSVKQVPLFAEYKSTYSLVDIVHKLTNLEVIQNIYIIYTNAFKTNIAISLSSVRIS